jgi:parallel beta-helix repeat protein
LIAEGSKKKRNKLMKRKIVKTHVMLTLLLASLLLTISASEGTIKQVVQTQALSASSSTPSVPPTVEWVKKFGTGGIDQASWIIQTNDGGYAAIGSFSDYIGGTFYGRDELVKMDSSGNMQWNQTSRGHVGLVQTGDGGYTIVGNGDGGIMLSKVDSKGVSQWNQTYKVQPQDEFGNSAASMIQTKDGGYAIAGCTGSYLIGENPNQALLIRVSSYGQLLWSKAFGKHGQINFFRSVVQTSDGGYALAGTTSDGAGGSDFWLVKTNSLGELIWSKTYGGLNGDDANSVVQTSDGGYAIAGNTNSFGADNSSQAWLVKTDTWGNLQWTKTYEGSAISLIQTNEGGLAFAGSNNGDAWLVKTGSAGKVEWNQTFGNTYYNGPGSRNMVSADYVIETNDGGFALAGAFKAYNAPSRGGYYWYIVKTKPALSSPSSSSPPQGPAPVLAFPSITIRADGEVDPSSAPVEHNGNVYTLTRNLNGPLVVEKDNIVVDGAGHSLQGNGSIAGLYIRVTETGIDLTGRTNVTVENVQIAGYNYGILLDGSEYVTVSRNTLTQNNQGVFLTCSAFTSISVNNITQNSQGIVVTGASSNSKIIDNNIMANQGDGIWLNDTNGNIICGNDISNDTSNYLPAGVLIDSGSNNLITGNVLNRDLFGIHMRGATEVIVAGNTFIRCERNAAGDNASGGVFYMNNFYNLHPNVFDEGPNSWDNGTVGNYWENYTQMYPDAKEIDHSGIGDTPYVIGTDNTDYHPLMASVSNASALTLANALIMEHPTSPITLPSSTGLLSPLNLLLLASVTLVAAIIVFGAVVFLKHRKKQT